MKHEKNSSGDIMQSILERFSNNEEQQILISDAIKETALPADYEAKLQAGIVKLDSLTSDITEKQLNEWKELLDVDVDVDVKKTLPKN